MINRSIFRQLLFSHLALILTGLVTVGLVVSWLVKGFIFENRREQLVREACQANLALVDSPFDKSQPIQETLAFLAQAFGAELWLFTPDGEIVATSAKAEVYVGKWVAAGVVEKVLKGQAVVESLSFPNLPEPMLSVVVPWGTGDDLQGGLILHAPLRGLNQTVGQVRETILWATLVAVVLSASIGSYLSWSISRPLKEIESVATEIGRGVYDRRLEMARPDEIGDLAAAINAMAAQLASVEQERRSLQEAREDLFANISHELRTPLTAIIGFLEALQDGIAQNREQEQLYLAVTYREALQLKRMVEDLLDLARLTSGRVQLQRSPVDVAAVAREVCQNLNGLAAAKRNLLRFHGSGALPLVMADPFRLRQILTNLIENAIKFTEAGRIIVTASGESAGVVIRVSDTGIGIEAEKLPMIWERFYKGDPLRGRNRGGTGLGLAIVRELVERHGGEIAVESQVGRGTTFTLRLPALESGS